jgi:hypothetical protein
VIDLSSIALRIAGLEASGSLSESTALLLQHAHNDIAADVDALRAKIAKFGERIDAVEYDASRSHLVAEATAHFDRLIAEIKGAATKDDLDGPRKIVDTFSLWRNDHTD